MVLLVVTVVVSLTGENMLRTRCRRQVSPLVAPRRGRRSHAFNSRRARATVEAAVDFLMMMVVRVDKMMLPQWLLQRPKAYPRLLIIGPSA